MVRVRSKASRLEGMSYRGKNTTDKKALTFQSVPSESNKV
jgi:hypothetical protein